MSRTNFHGPKDVWAIEVWLYMFLYCIIQQKKKKKKKLSGYLSNLEFWCNYPKYLNTMASYWNSKIWMLYDKLVEWQSVQTQQFDQGLHFLLMTVYTV